ncbi:MAG: hypothetical protein O7F10_08170 [Deltaproteobacteria bacterium]|nr:hypothetical protein [Deltaproteobacteria bacterium]
MRYLSFFAAVCVVLLLAHRALAAAVVFSDPNFEDADWELTVFEDGLGGTITAMQMKPGNPGGYREVRHDLQDSSMDQGPSRVAGLHLLSGASYDPTAEGPIATLDYSQDALGIEIFGAGMRTQPLISQAGKAYVATGWLVDQPVWTTFSLSGLTATDFVLLPPDLDVDPSVHPDFSESGALLSLGFASRNSTGSGLGFTMIVGIDNWRISIHPDELAICEEELFRLLADEDGEVDLTDLCASTKPLAEVDSDGCSLEQFCSEFGKEFGTKDCPSADWQNDEPSMKASEQDCAIDKGGPGKADDLCVAAP